MIPPVKAWYPQCLMAITLQIRSFQVLTRTFCWFILSCVFYIPFESQLFKGYCNNNLSELSTIYIGKKTPGYLPPVSPSSVSLLFFIEGNKGKKSTGCCILQSTVSVPSLLINKNLCCLSIKIYPQVVASSLLLWERVSGESKTL